jgi:3-hydroxybutyryl-CoA dehydratase
MNMYPGNIKFEDIVIGMTASYSQTITDYDVKNFAGLSGDHNPVHLDDEYAKNSRFKNRIAHGLISGSFFSALFGTRLPGPGCVYVSQSFQFKKPVYLGDTVKAIVEVIDINAKNRRIHFRTVCKVGHRTVIDGQAELYVP